MVDAEDAQLVALRREMDGLNERLFALLEERVRLAAAIGDRKRVLSLPIHDPIRESAEVEATRATIGDLDPEARERILRVVLEETRRAQGSR